MINKSIVNKVNFNQIYKDGGIIRLAPKENILPSLEKIAKEKFNISYEDTKKFVQDNGLNAYCVAVFIPPIHNPEELLLHIKINYKTYLNIMMTAWPFPIEWWNFQDKSFDFFEELVNVTYYPVVLNAIHTSYTDLLNLSVTLANPTQEFMSHVITYIIANESTLSEEDVIYLKFLTSSGIAIISNTPEKTDDQDPLDRLIILADSKHVLSALKNKILVTLFSRYFTNNMDWPDEISDDFLSKWFDTQTLSGIYLIPSNAY